MNSETTAALIKKYPSMVVLPPLPKSIRTILSKHDKSVLDIFAAYVTAYAKEHNPRLGPDDKLPLSRFQYASEGPTTPSSLDRHLQETAIKVTARSTFVANSGHDDNFKSVSELARTVREGVYLNQHAIPSTAHLAMGGTKEHELNAYLLDFYTHGQKESLTKANGIRPNDVWYYLEDFALTLSLMKAALEQLFTKNAKAIYEKVKGETGVSVSESGRDLDGEESVGQYQQPCFRRLIMTLHKG